MSFGERFRLFLSWNIHIIAFSVFFFFVFFPYFIVMLLSSRCLRRFWFPFFLAVVVLILLYGCTTWALTKRLEKNLDDNSTKMFRAILNTYWRQHPTRHQLYGHLPPITKTIQVRRTRHSGHSWRSKDELIRDELQWRSKSRTTSSNIHTAAMRGYGI